MPDNDIKTTPSNRDTPPMRSPDGNDRGSPSAASAGDDSRRRQRRPRPAVHRPRTPGCRDPALPIETRTANVKRA
jgi:hypothetical protein